MTPLPLKWRYTGISVSDFHLCRKSNLYGMLCPSFVRPAYRVLEHFLFFHYFLSIYNGEVFLSCIATIERRFEIKSRRPGDKKPNAPQMWRTILRRMWGSERLKYRDAPSSKRNANQTIETKNRGGKILLDFCWLLNAGIVGDGQLIQAGQVTQVAHVTWQKTTRQLRVSWSRWAGQLAQVAHGTWQ